MSQVVIGINFAIAVSGLTICILGLWQALHVPYLELVTRKFLVAIFAVLVCYVALDLFSQIIDDFRGVPRATAQRIELTIESILPSLAGLLLTAFILHERGNRNWQHSIAFRVNTMLLVAYVAMNVWTVFSGIFYYITDDNVYQRGPLYPILLIPTLLIMLVNALVLVDCRLWLTSRQRRAFTAYLVAPIVGMLWQMIVYGIYTLLIGVTIGAIAMISFILSDAAERHWMHERELARMRSELALSQIKPHFVCNTVGSHWKVVRE